jgi:hypothetical protein
VQIYDQQNKQVVSKLDSTTTGFPITGGLAPVISQDSDFSDGRNYALVSEAALKAFVLSEFGWYYDIMLPLEAPTAEQGLIPAAPTGTFGEWVLPASQTTYLTTRFGHVFQGTPTVAQIRVIYSTLNMNAGRINFSYATNHFGYGVEQSPLAPQSPQFVSVNNDTVGDGQGNPMVQVWELPDLPISSHSMTELSITRGGTYGGNQGPVADTYASDVAIHAICMRVASRKR